MSQTGTASPVLDDFHPLVRDWFVGRFAEPTYAQEDGWPAIRTGEDCLIAAPTGSGKTLTAFLAGIDELIREGELNDGGALPDEVRILYISPLKALSNDIRRNLEEPLTEIRQLADERGVELPQIRMGVRTGDTTQSERRSIVKRPPQILITTPESLYLMLTAKLSREILRTVRTVIVDEIPRRRTRQARLAPGPLASPTRPCRGAAADSDRSVRDAEADERDCVVPDRT